MKIFRITSSPGHKICYVSSSCLTKVSFVHPNSYASPIWELGQIWREVERENRLCVKRCCKGAYMNRYADIASIRASTPGHLRKQRRLFFSSLYKLQFFFSLSVMHCRRGGDWRRLIASYAKDQSSLSTRACNGHLKRISDRGRRASAPRNNR